MACCSIVLDSSFSDGVAAGSAVVDGLVVSSGVSVGTCSVVVGDFSVWGAASSLI